MMVWDPGMMTLMPWLLIFPGMAMLLAERTRRTGLWTIIAGYAVAAGAGQLTPLAAVPIAVLIAAGWAIQAARPTWVKAIGHVLFVATALGLALHLLPGFKNPLALAGSMSPSAIDYRMYLNLDKALIAVWVLWAWPAVAWAKPTSAGIRQGLLWGAGTGAVCLVLGAAAGLLGWEPKWPQGATLWALNNLLLVCMAEEAFFRGYVQQGLTTLMGKRRYAAWIGLVVAALLFGLAHFAAGPAMMAIAAVAGLGYGMAYRRGGLLAAIVAHFALNALHLLLFTYPLMR